MCECAENAYKFFLEIIAKAFGRNKNESKLFMIGIAHPQNLLTLSHIGDFKKNIKTTI